jgi:DNA-binding response OmpR family regulator
VLVLTAYDLPHLHATVRGTGANDLVQKPYDQEELLLRMARLLAA